MGDGVLDLVVIGCGPAGLALAAESAKLGLKVGLIGPDLPFTNNYGVWEDEFKGKNIKLNNISNGGYLLSHCNLFILLVWQLTCSHKSKKFKWLILLSK